MKIADFGFAAPVAGRDGSGYLKTKLGTESYMSPEIHARRPYVGPSVDLFAAAIILFIMFTQHPPFTRAEPTDPFYRLICANRSDLFWKAHSKNKPNGAAYFSEEFKNLITGLIQFDPALRPQMADVRNHPWLLNEDCATLEEIQGELKRRKGIIDAENEAKRAQKERERQQQMLAAGTGRKQYRTVGVAHRSSDETEAEEAKHQLRVVDKYFPGMKNNTEFFSTFSPAELLGEINGYITDHKGTAAVHDKKFKLVAKLKYDDLEDEEEEDNEEINEDKEEENKEQQEASTQVEFNVKILQVGDSDKYCVEFNHIEGDKLVFYQVIQKLRDNLADLANASSTA